MELTNSEVNYEVEQVYKDELSMVSMEDVLGPFSDTRIDMAIKRDDNDDVAYDFETISSKQAVKDAEKSGCDIVLPYLNQLQLDIDSQADYDAFQKNLKKFRLHIGYVSIFEEHMSKSGDPEKRHVTLMFERELDPQERILFQLFLGSDRTRELLSYIRYINDDENPTLFFEKKRLLLNA
jgi:hypothetical protein